MSEPADRVQAILSRYPVWEKKTVFEAFQEAVRSYGSRELIWTPGVRFTYEEAFVHVARIAAGFIEIGINPGDHVALVMANFPEHILIKLALAKVGAVCVPINFRFRSHEWRHTLRECEASTLILMDRFHRFDYLALLKSLCPEAFQGLREKPSAAFPHLRRVVAFSRDGKTYDGIHNFEEFADYPRLKASYKGTQKNGARKAASPDDLCDIIYTYPSWDGGIPRGAMMTHDMVLRCGFSSALSRAYEDGRRVLFSLPLYHVYGYIEGLISCFFVGGAVILQEYFDPEETLKMIEEARATDMLAVPTMMLALLQHQTMGRYDLSSLRSMLCAGTAAPPDLWPRIKEVMGIDELSSGYGMTEVCGGSMHTAPETSPETLHRVVGRIISAGACGLPSMEGRHIEYKTIDLNTGKDLSLGQEGEWVCRGLRVTPGFYGRAEETRRCIDAGGWLRTGDVGIIHENGSFELTGRCKNVYRMGGESVSPQEVEEVLRENPKVVEAHVVPMPDKRFIEVGMAFILLKDEENATRSELIDFLKPRIARYKVPAYISFVSEGELPRQTSGEIDRAALIRKGIQDNGLGEIAEKVRHYQTIPPSFGSHR